MANTVYHGRNCLLNLTSLRRFPSANVSSYEQESVKLLMKRLPKPPGRTSSKARGRMAPGQTFGPVSSITNSSRSGSLRSGAWGGAHFGWRSLTPIQGDQL